MNTALVQRRSRARSEALVSPSLLLGSLALAALCLLSSRVQASETALRFLLLGDSITYGFVGGPPGDPFIDLLQARFPEVEVVNGGCFATTTTDWNPLTGNGLCRMGFEVPMFEAMGVDNLPADVVVIMLGTNDATGFLERMMMPVSPLDYGSHLAQMSEALFVHGAARVMLMIPPLNPGSSAEVTARLTGYREQILALCGAEILCGPDLQMILDFDEHFAGNDAHPNAAGHASIAEALETEIRLALPEPEGPAQATAVCIALAWLRHQRRAGGQARSSPARSAPPALGPVRAASPGPGSWVSRRPG